MQPLSTVLTNTQLTASDQDQKSALSAILQRGLTSAVGKTTTAAWTLGQQARNHTINPKDAALLLLRLREIRSFNKRVDSWTDSPPYGKTLTVSYEWQFPEDFDHETARALVFEASRPCGGATVRYFIALARTKKLTDIDQSNAEKYLLTFVRDLMEFCELSVIAALDDLRKEDDSPWFPTIAEIRNRSKAYHKAIVSAQAYLSENRLDRPVVAENHPVAASPHKNENDPFGGRMWPEFNDNDRALFFERLGQLNLRAARQIWIDSFDAPPELVANDCAELTNNEQD